MQSNSQHKLYEIRHNTCVGAEADESLRRKREILRKRARKGGAAHLPAALERWCFRGALMTKRSCATCQDAFYTGLIIRNKQGSFFGRDTASRNRDDRLVSVEKCLECLWKLPVRRTIPEAKSRHLDRPRPVGGTGQSCSICRKSECESQVQPRPFMSQAAPECLATSGC